MLKCRYLIAIFFIICCTLEFKVTLDPSKMNLCFKINIPTHSTLHGHFLIAGEENIQINLRVYSAEKKSLVAIEGRANSNFSIYSQSINTNHTLCLERGDFKEKHVILNWKIVDHLLEGNKSEELEQTENALISYHTKLIDLKNSLLFQISARNNHLKYHEKDEKSLDSWMWTTIGIMIAISIFETFIAIKFFSSKENEGGIYHKKIN